MPRVSRTRTSLPGHAKSAKTISTPDALDDSYMMDPAEMAPMQASRYPPLDRQRLLSPDLDSPALQKAPRFVEPAAEEPATAIVPLDEVAKAHHEQAPRLTKAEKAQAKRQNLLDQINSRSNPYSKSHSRRLKRAARPEANLVTSLSDVHDVLPEIEPAFDEPEASDEDGRPDEMHDDRVHPVSHAGKGKEKMTAKKRQRVLTNESTRLPAILANSSFSKSPFATIRMHTLNTFAAEKAQQGGATAAKRKGAKK
ncbi:hypothetical protein JCM11491_002276 [Sporobolomyces phaffii]